MAVIYVESWRLTSLSSFDVVKDVHEGLGIYLRVSCSDMKDGLGMHTLRGSECQLVFSSRSSWQCVSLMEHVGMQFSELDRLVTHSLHPAPMANILRDESSPDRNCLKRSAARCGLKSDAPRVLISEDAECVEGCLVLDFSAVY